MPDVRYSDKGIIPIDTVAVTIGIDTQSDGFYYLLACWGRGKEVWLPLTDFIVGDMRSEEPWQALVKVLVTTWLDRDGNAYRPVVAGIDVQGDFYPECLEFVRAYGGKCRLRALRGLGRDKAQAGMGAGILRNSYRDKATGVIVQNVDVDIAKTTLANMLARSGPGPGYVHLPCGADFEDAGGWDLEATEELNAEYRRTKHIRGYEVERWYKYSGRPNHRLDCLCYSLAALALSRLKIDDCELQRVEARNVGQTQQGHDQRPRYGPQPVSFFGDMTGYPADSGRREGIPVVAPPGQRRRPRWGVQQP